MFCLGGPGETTKDLENVKHAIRESKRESKGVPTRDITDGLIDAVLDMGLIVSDNDGKGNCLFHALSEQLETVKKIKIPHDELRKTLVQYLRNGRFCLVFISAIKNCVNCSLSYIIKSDIF